MPKILLAVLAVSLLLSACGTRFVPKERHTPRNEKGYDAMGWHPSSAVDDY